MTAMRIAVGRSLRAPIVNSRRHAAPSRVAWHDLAACTLLPNLHWLSFAVHAGHVALVVFSHRVVGDGRVEVIRSHLDVHQAQVRRHGDVSWDLHRPCATCHWSWPQQVPPEVADSRLLSVVACQLLSASVRVADGGMTLPPAPVLPPTLLGLPPRSGVEPYPTPLVIQHARRRQIHWAEAWGELCLRLRQPDLERRLNQRLIDARLIPPTAHVLDEWHLIQPLLGRRIANPANRVKHSVDILSSMLRDYVPPLLASGCTDDDLQRAAQRPAAPVIASRLAKIQVWRPRPAFDRPLPSPRQFPPSTFLVNSLGALRKATP